MYRQKCETTICKDWSLFFFIVDIYILKVYFTFEYFNIIINYTLNFAFKSKEIDLETFFVKENITLSILFYNCFIKLKL
jgi:hypothetical protein